MKNNSVSLCSAAGREPVRLVIVCFGTPSIAGDALGPFVGDALREENLPFYVYGTSDSPITGTNMKEKLRFIKEAHRGSVILAVDACLSDRTKLGGISIRADGVCPAAVGGRKTRFGDVGVLAAVGSREGDHLTELMSADLLYISKLADKVAFVIKSALAEFLRECAAF